MLPGLRAIHDRCQWWAYDHLEALEQTPEVELPAELDNRAEDAWRLLLAIAGQIGEVWAARAHDVAVVVSRLRGQNDQSQGTMLLRDIKQVFIDQKRNWLESKTICSKLAEREDRHWGDMTGVSITPRKLAELLKPCKIYPHPDTTGKKRCYPIDAFADAWERYT
jgi:hypothetical protein